ncbi:HlyD family secretion protein [Thalassotalea agarivorans]|uniref:Membrane fusion protein n=1 Tax=Thalassotalea agarivorans TaxID=349064 RepID=A0A1I0GCC9_THASX|nr:HlyD family efflux transporter periplasmic adaptor subunit [Thalassotalea agarivorans]SET67674.1 membrane fusion protein [Thalassotalea agarivorans]
MSLFRKEVFEHQYKNKLVGDIPLAQPLSLNLTIALFISLICLTFCFLASSSFARKETVSGYLIPSKGIINAYGQSAGIIEKILVKEGEFIQKGQVLATIKNQSNNVDGKDNYAFELEQLDRQKQLLSLSIEQHELVHNQNTLQLSSQIDNAVRENKLLNNQLNHLDQTKKLLTQQHNRLLKLSAAQHLSRIELDRHTQKLLSISNEIERTKLQQLSLANRLQADRSQLLLAPKNLAIATSALKRQLAALEQQIQNVSTSSRYSVIAHQSGYVGAIQMREGQYLTPRKPIIKLIPKDAQLIAELLVPSRSAGFIKSGMQTKLSFDAFPLQRFGFMESQLSSIDKVLYQQADEQMPVSIREPFYIVRATLAHQSLEAFGKSFQLKSGMKLQADIVLEERTVLQWLLDPILSVSAKLG